MEIGLCPYLTCCVFLTCLGNLKCERRQATIPVPTPAGPVMVTVPKGPNTGTVLRLRGRGVARKDGTRGDAFVTLRLVLPDAPDAALEAFAEGWEAGRAQDPRAGMES